MSNIHLDAFKTNFNINTDTTDVNFRKITASPYNSSLEADHDFGEKKSLLYQVELTVFNVEVLLKIFAFKYESYAEALKLKIRICNDKLEKEMVSCRNFLQRKRNMNLVFEVLVKFAKLFEMRRLICSTVLQKRQNVVVVRDSDGTAVKCFSRDGSVLYLEFNWSLLWNVDTYEVSDFIEFCLKNSVFPHEREKRIKSHLEDLVRPKLDFQSKLKLWSYVMCELYDETPRMRRDRTVPPMTDVLEIDDSDSDENDIIEIDQSICGPPNHNNDEVMVID